MTDPVLGFLEPPSDPGRERDGLHQRFDGIADDLAARRPGVSRSGSSRRSSLCKSGPKVGGSVPGRPLGTLIGPLGTLIECG
jgi:hypothetical protein